MKAIKQQKYLCSCGYVSDTKFLFCPACKRIAIDNKPYFALFIYNLVIGAVVVLGLYGPIRYGFDSDSRRQAVVLVSGWLAINAMLVYFGFIRRR